jgi:DNA polymerase-3 subunit epsilon
LLLAGVYVELLGERQATLGLGGQTVAETRARLQMRAAKLRPAPLPARLSEQAQAAHREFVKTLGPDALWLRYLTVPQA